MFPNFEPPGEETHEIFFHIPGKPYLLLENENKTKKLLQAQLYYSIIANLRINIPPTFLGIFGIFGGILKSLFIYTTISRGTPNDVQGSSKFPRNLCYIKHCSSLFTT